MADYTESVLLPKSVYVEIQTGTPTPNKDHQVDTKPSVDNEDTNRDENLTSIRKALDTAWQEDEKKSKSKKAAHPKKWNFIKKTLDAMWEGTEKEKPNQLGSIKEQLDAMWEGRGKGDRSVTRRKKTTEEEKLREIKAGLDKLWRAERKAKFKKMLETFWREDPDFLNTVTGKSKQKFKDILNKFWGEDPSFYRSVMGKSNRKFKDKIDKFWREDPSFYRAVTSETAKRKKFKDTLDRFWAEDPSFYKEIIKPKAHKKGSKEFQKKLDQFWRQDPAFYKEVMRKNRGGGGAATVLKKTPPAGKKRKFKDTLDKFWAEDPTFYKEVGKPKARKKNSKEFEKKLDQFWKEDPTFYKEMTHKGKTKADRDKELKQLIGSRYLKDASYLKKLYYRLKNKSKEKRTKLTLPRSQSKVSASKLSTVEKQQLLKKRLDRRRLADQKHLRKISKAFPRLTSESTTDAVGVVKKDNNNIINQLQTDQDILTHFAPDVMPTVKQILTIIRKKPEIISWAKPNMEIVLHGLPIPNTRLTDILEYLLNDTPVQKKFITSVGPNDIPKGAAMFLNALKEYFPKRDYGKYIQFNERQVDRVKTDAFTTERLEKIDANEKALETALATIRKDGQAARDERAFRRREEARGETKPMTRDELEEIKQQKERRRALLPSEIAAGIKGMKQRRRAMGAEEIVKGVEKMKADRERQERLAELREARERRERIAELRRNIRKHVPVLFRRPEGEAAAAATPMSDVGLRHWALPGGKDVGSYIRRKPAVSEPKTAKERAEALGIPIPFTIEEEEDAIDDAMGESIRDLFSSSKEKE